jgi:hypothetical protein
MVGNGLYAGRAWGIATRTGWDDFYIIPLLLAVRAWLGWSLPAHCGAEFASAMRRKFFDLIWVWSEGGGGRLRIACIDSLFTGYRADVLY